MRFGICLPGNFTLENSVAAGESELLRALVDGYRFIKEIGYDYIEFSVGNLMAMSDEDMEKAVKYYQQGLVKVEASNGFIPGTMALTGETVDKEAIRGYLEKSLKRAASLGVKIVVFGSGAARRIPDGFPEEQAKKQLDEFMILAEGIARPLGITIVIEPLNHKETNVFLTVTESSKTVRRLNLPNLKVLADLYHTYVENEEPQVLKEQADILYHVHVAEPEKRGIPVEHPYLAACGEVLRMTGYSGGISIECRAGEYIPEITGALPVMKKLFKG